MFVRLRYVLFTFVFYAVVAANANESSEERSSRHPTVDTPSGKLKGSIIKTWTNKRCYSFRGIPFAEAPVGRLRFKVSYRFLLCIHHNFWSDYLVSYD